MQTHKIPGEIWRQIHSPANDWHRNYKWWCSSHWRVWRGPSVLKDMSGNVGMGGAEALMELLKAFNIAGDVSHAPAILPTDYATMGISAAHTATSGWYIFGVNAEVEPTLSMRGLSTVKKPLSVSMNFAATLGNDGGGAAMHRVISCIVHFDQLVYLYPTKIEVIN